MRVPARRTLAGLAAQALALTLVACGGGGEGNSSPPPSNSPDTVAPSIPAGVTATAISPTQVQLGWTASTDAGTGVAGYRVFRNGGATPIASVTTTGYTDSNLTPTTSYTYTVRAFDGATPPNESAFSTAATATTPDPPVIDTTPPTVPANFTGTALSTTEIRLSWTASTDSGIGVAGYHVYRNGATTPTATVNGATTFTDIGLTANTTYTYALRAFDAATPANVSGPTATLNVNTLAVADTTPPTVPGTLTATALSSSSIRLNWIASTDAGTGVAGYRVYQNGSATPLAGTITAVTTTITGLAANTQYSFAVTAIDRANPPNESGASNSASATTPGNTDTTAPSVPTGVQAAAQSSTSIQVSWAASTDDVAVAGYRIFRNGSTTIHATVSSGTSYTDTGLTPATSYSYQVRAFDTAATPNVSGLSTPAASATTLSDTTAPGVPAVVSATALSLTEIRIDWSASTDQGGAGLAGYRIYRNGNSSILATVTGGTSYTDAALTPNTTYSYQVRAFDAAIPPNVSALSTPAASATTQADTAAPSVPSNVIATAQSGTQIRIDWTASTDVGVGVAGYRIYRDGSTSVLATVTNGTSFTDTGLTLGTTYSYQVLAFDGATPANVSALSAPASAITQNDDTPPTDPSGVTATALSSTQIRIDWMASTDVGGLGVAGYRIYRNGSASVLATVTGGTSHTDSGLNASTAYSYQVRAFDNAVPTNLSGLSTPPASATTTTDITAPTVPSGVTATAQSISEIRIDWTASVDQGGGALAGYRIYRNGSSSVLATVTGTTFTDSGLTASTAYSYQVRAFDNAATPNVSALSTPAATATTLADTTAPSVPGMVAAAAQSSTAIQVTWLASTDNVAVAGYRIYRNGSSTSLATVTSGTTYDDTGLAPNTAYSYQVRAFDNAATPNVSGLSTPAATATTLADTTAPTVPAGLNATALSSTSIRIDWSASTDSGGAGLAGYRIFRDGSSTALATVTSGTTYTDTGLTAGTSYGYQLRAFDNATPANVSGLSTAANATTHAMTSGLDTRPGNTSCVAGAPPSQSANFTWQRVFGNLTFDAGVQVLQAPGDSSRWFVVQQAGLIKVFNNTSNPTASNFIDLTGVVRYDGEMGLLGMAFHPDFPMDPRVYLSFVTGSASSRTSYIAEFQTSNGGTTLDASTRYNLLSIPQPEENHKGGNLMFGPDGYLYAGFGDGGGGGDQHGTIGNGQRLNTLLSKMIRIDVGNTPQQPYTIPAGNPYSANTTRCNANDGASGTMCPEIYAYGFRNPWRWSFDAGTGELWVGDVGESDWEEIDLVTLGGNYGWRCREGNHAYNGTCGPNAGSAINPVVEINHTSANSITGGYVYRGSAISGLVGRYVFGDFSMGYIWNIARNTTPTQQLTASTAFGTPHGISSFGEGVDKELYYLDYYGGMYKIVPSGGGGGGTVASLLSQTGCANSSNPKLPASGMIPYAPNAAFWSDGAVKTRWLALPNGQRIAVDGTSNHFDFPNGSVLRKDFTLNGTLAETRLFMRHTDGNWAGYTYQWNAQGTEATRVVGGLTTTINGQTWEFPTEGQCLTCHTSAAGRTLGLETGQLNGDLLYPATGRTANQVYTLNFIDTLTPPITLPIDQLPLIPNPSGSAPLVDRARAWLHTNCANCHRPSGGTPVNLDFRYTTSLLGTNTCDVQPNAGNLGIANARLIAPGDAARSVVIARVNRTDSSMMPPLARHTIDTDGVQLLTGWVNSLSGCN
jgi:uncharacterized repeat protein (TIGR03806 family)